MRKLVPILAITALFLGLASVTHAQSNTPSFSDATYTRDVAENATAGENVGAPVTATGGTGTLTYTLGGTDAASFDIVSASGQIRTKEGVTYDHEAKSSYSVTVTATDTGSNTAGATVTITVTDVNEPPLPPPLVEGVGVPNTYDSIYVRWDPPDNTGRPPITGYDVQYRDIDEEGNSAWFDGPQEFAGREAAITGLRPGEFHPVRVRAKNDEGESLWGYIGFEDGLPIPAHAHNLPIEIETESFLNSIYSGFVPPDLGPGDEYRLLFAAQGARNEGPIDATSGRTGTYVDRIWYVANSSDALIGPRHNYFFTMFPLVSTPLVDAREITNSTYTEDDKGVPIYWIHGSRVADDNEDFWDGSWADETNIRDEDGNAIQAPNGVWTGSASDGTELIENGVSRAMGEPQVGYGTPGSTMSGVGAIESGSTGPNTEERLIYGLSLVWRIVAPGVVANLDQYDSVLDELKDEFYIGIGDPISLSPEQKRQLDNLIEQYYADNTDDRTHRRSQQFTTGPHLHGYGNVGFQVSYTDVAGLEGYSLAVYTVDGTGHPDTLVATLTYPAADSYQELTFDAPEGTVLSPNTTYAMVVIPDNPAHAVRLNVTGSDDEDEYEREEGWSIADAFDIESGGSWSAHPDSKALLIRVRATPKTGPPGKPTGLTAAAMGRHQIDLSWTAPEQDGGAEIAGYQIEVSDDGGTNWTGLAADTGTDATTYEHTGLRPNTTVHYRVSAINSVGTSPASDTANTTTEDFPAVTVQYGQDSYTLAEGETVNVTISLSEDPLQETVIPITATNQGGASSADYSTLPATVTFNEGDTEKTIAFMAVNDTEDDDDESVRLGFGSSLPAKVSVGTRNTTTLNIGDNDHPVVVVQFSQSALTVAEGGTQAVTVTLDADPERTVIIPIGATGQGGATAADYSGVPSSVTFSAGEMEKSFTFAATQDVIDDDGESVKLSFGTMPDARISAGTTDEVTFNIVDDDDPLVTAMFTQNAYTVAEGDDTSTTGVEENKVEVTVTLSADPERTVVIPMETDHQGGATAADYSGVPPSVTFHDGEMSKSFTFTAIDDTEDDDDESVKLSFGTMPDARIIPGTPDEVTLNIVDDDDPQVSVRFVQAAYSVAEGEEQAVRVTLSANPERTVVIPLAAMEQDGASSADYSGVPQSVTFNSGDTSKSFTFMATDDDVGDDGESVLLRFGTLPSRVNTGSPNETTVTIRQFSDEFILDCNRSVWCADLEFADQSMLDWGWPILKHGRSIDPSSSLSDDSFTFRGVEYRVRDITLHAGTYPTMPNIWSSEEQGNSTLSIIVDRGRHEFPPPKDHYRDWVLHIDGLELPFLQAIELSYSEFVWVTADLQQLYNDWTPSDVTKIGIEEVAAADQLTNFDLPWQPVMVTAWADGRTGLDISWFTPRWSYRLPKPTGYVVQWKLASASWSDPTAVTERQVEGRHVSSLKVGGLMENTLYSARVFAFNDAGDGPISQDALGRTQPELPYLQHLSVNGATLTLHFNLPLDGTRVPDATAFVVMVDQGLRTVDTVAISGNRVILTLAKAVQRRQSGAGAL